MVLVRFVCHAKFGTAGEVISGFMRSGAVAHRLAGPNVQGRILSDLSGPFDTVVLEIEVENLAEWEQLRGSLFSNPEFQKAEAEIPNFIESGRTEYYTIEAMWPDGH